MRLLFPLNSSADALAKINRIIAVESHPLAAKGIHPEHVHTARYMLSVDVNGPNSLKPGGIESRPRQFGEFFCLVHGP
ncbi:unnamed protein product [Periconia digitata]|uniref:Uncharacterized protein n=1 Tax=Periconia digitata TaxID=1303443 RepID=A0A9W4UG58_9PLEO|nr:unnamed protein product [Periconia digitata]